MEALFLLLFIVPKTLRLRARLLNHYFKYFSNTKSHNRSNINPYLIFFKPNSQPNPKHKPKTKTDYSRHYQYTNTKCRNRFYCNLISINLQRQNSKETRTLFFLIYISKLTKNLETHFYLFYFLDWLEFRNLENLGNSSKIGNHKIRK